MTTDYHIDDKDSADAAEFTDCYPWACLYRGRCSSEGYKCGTCGRALGSKKDYYEPIPDPYGPCPYPWYPSWTGPYWVGNHNIPLNYIS